MSTLIKLPAFLTLTVLLLISSGCCNRQEHISTIYLAGDSTVADYTQYDNYMSERYPVTGWGQVFQQFFRKDSLSQLSALIHADSVVVDDRARGGRSTRTFFQEGRWRAICDSLGPGDLVLIQFGHNDASVNKPERYVNVEGYKEFLSLFVTQTREKKAVPILLTPVNRNYPWEGDRLTSSHGAYADAVRETAEEMNVLLIDLTRLSCEFFSSRGRDYVTEHYFMNLPPGKYRAYPDGQNDNTHFQPEGAKAVARLVFEAMKHLEVNPNKSTQL
ncbi:MAG: rhamnogalacturonan acetylesterase [Bacteroidales bacterium]